jgi:hypothetical protein
MSTLEWLAGQLFLVALLSTMPLFLLGIHGLPGAPTWVWTIQAGVLLAYWVGVVFLVRSRRLRPVWKAILAVLSYFVAMFCSNYICIEVCLRYIL